MHHPIKTVITLDKATTLELDGAPKTGRGVNCVVTHIKNLDQDNTEKVEIEFKLTDENVRNLTNVLDTYR